jgi:hypothetical protein
VVSLTDPYGRILGFLDRVRYSQEVVIIILVNSLLFMCRVNNNNKKKKKKKKKKHTPTPLYVFMAQGLVS